MNLPRMIIGLTGLREAGKSTVARMLSEYYDFEKAHAFGPGKHMTIKYYEYIGIDGPTAWEMVHGNLKDTPHPLLPGGCDSRFFMESLGKFMGVNLGPEWTLGMELTRAERLHPTQSLVLESVVYEYETAIKHGATIIRVIRPGHVGPEGKDTDEFQKQIKEDYILINDGTKDKLKAKLDDLIQRISVKIKFRENSSV